VRRYQSGLVCPVAVFLFESMFRLHLLGHRYRVPAPDALAHLDAVAQVLLPMLLIAGLATRFSALALLAMTGVIQLTDPSGWANFHLPWADLALTTMALGPGKASLDYALKRALRGRAAR
jgi:putative oxidoreductase